MGADARNGRPAHPPGSNGTYFLGTEPRTAVPDIESLPSRITTLYRQLTA